MLGVDDCKCAANGWGTTLEDGTRTGFLCARTEPSGRTSHSLVAWIGCEYVRTLDLCEHASYIFRPRAFRVDKGAGNQERVRVWAEARPRRETRELPENGNTGRPGDLPLLRWRAQRDESQRAYGTVTVVPSPVAVMMYVPAVLDV